MMRFLKRISSSGECMVCAHKKICKSYMKPIELDKKLFEFISRDKDLMSNFIGESQYYFKVVCKHFQDE